MTVMDPELKRGYRKLPRMVLGPMSTRLMRRLAPIMFPKVALNGLTIEEIPTPGASKTMRIYRLQVSKGFVTPPRRSASGNTEQLDPVRVPWSKTMGSFDCGAFVYLSAQNNNDTGSITCKIKAGGVTIEEASSSGAYVIASCSGSVSG